MGIFSILDQFIWRLFTSFFTKKEKKEKISAVTLHKKP